MVYHVSMVSQYVSSIPTWERNTPRQTRPPFKRDMQAEGTGRKLGTSRELGTSWESHIEINPISLLGVCQLLIEISWRVSHREVLIFIVVVLVDKDTTATGLYGLVVCMSFSWRLAYWNWGRKERKSKMGVFLGVEKKSKKRLQVFMEGGRRLYVSYKREEAGTNNTNQFQIVLFIKKKKSDWLVKLLEFGQYLWW